MGQAERSSKQAIRIPPEAAAAEAAAAAAAAANQQHQTSSIMRRSSSSSAACAGGFGDWGRSECCNSVQEMRAHQFMPIKSPAKSSSSSTSSTITVDIKICSSFPIIFNQTKGNMIFTMRSSAFHSSNGHIPVGPSPQTSPEFHGAQVQEPTAV